METKIFLCFIFTIQLFIRSQAQGIRYCPAGALRCQDGICIDFHFSCDGDADCYNISNTDVPYRTRLLGVRAPVNRLCKQSHFECANGRCVPLNWVCDTEDDCGDGSDERDCLPRDSPPCPVKLLQTYSRTLKKFNIKNVSVSCKRCITSEQDNTKLKVTIYPTKTKHYGDALVLQCRDESGLRAPVRWFREDNKSFTVGTGQFMGRLEINIVDEADGGGYVCQAASHLGSPGSEARVNVIVNSGNGDGDIRTIRKPRFKETQSECYEWQLQCVSDKLCLPLIWRCDGDIDCADGSDERFCFVPISSNYPDSN
ncbi:PREDICTED: very low-density lipoprotein receptor-like isoform X2 [Papilio xuthus]|uniref:Very low-density lipoprotein receptor-like isoform X2 n=1 Tax=Papilio xuthus TaxID=66420 RepID=A0AAJ7ELL8_PAPXU|nr:PREDICTED: very low-density lipoprotein receptor-like isoform X2 [Papilio xuthus]